MPLSRLTQRARILINEFSGKQRINASKVLSALSSSTGLGGTVLKDFPKLRVKSSKAIPINTLIKESYYQASVLDHPYVGTEHILLATLRLSNSTKFEVVRNRLKSATGLPKAVQTLAKPKENAILDTFGRDITREFYIRPRASLVYREELDKLLAILLKKENSNALLVGNCGVGKDSLVHLLAANISSLDIPPYFIGYRIIEFDLVGFVTSMSQRGNIETSLLSLKEELAGLKRVILSVKNFQSTFVSVSMVVGITLATSVLKELLEVPNARIITSLTPTLYDKISLDNDHLLESFSVIEVDEPSHDKLLEILTLKATEFSSFYNISIDGNILEYILDTLKEGSLSSNVKMPQKAINVLDIACAKLVVSTSRVPPPYRGLVDKTIVLMEAVDSALESGDYAKATKLQKSIQKVEQRMAVYEDKMVSSGDALTLVTADIDNTLRDLNYPDNLMEEDSNALLVGLDSLIKKEIIGQDKAVDTIVKALIRARLGLRAKKRPIGAFLFLGPTGVGKTELAKVLARFAFNDRSSVGDLAASERSRNARQNLIRLDMSDFGEKHTVARLVGAPPGYVGYGEGGELTQKISRNPHSVVLFDEIEKAHPDVLNILLQITEEAELTDAKGDTYDFSKAIVILTSNLGTEILHGNGIGFNGDIKFVDDVVLEKRLKGNLKKILKPELLNRFDELIVFRRLKKRDQMKILNLLLKEVKATLKEQHIKLKVSATAKKYLLSVGYSEEYGARELRRAVERELLDKIAEVLLHLDVSEKAVKANLDLPKKVTLIADISGDAGISILKQERNA